MEKHSKLIRVNGVWSWINENVLSIYYVPLTQLGTVRNAVKLKTWFPLSRNVKLLEEEEKNIYIEKIVIMIITPLTLPVVSLVPLSPGPVTAFLIHFKYFSSPCEPSVFPASPFLLLFNVPPLCSLRSLFSFWGYLSGVWCTRDSQMCIFRSDLFKQQHLHLACTQLP